MSIISSLIHRLKGSSAITAVVGTRIASNTSDQADAIPRMVLSLVSGDHAHHMQAASGRVVGRIQIEGYANTSLAATNLMELVRQRMDGFRGTIQGVYINTLHLDTERAFYLPPADGSQVGTHSIQHDYIVAWHVAVPTL
jgi:hypothetical protein